MNGALVVVGWALCSAFSFWATVDYHLRLWGKITRGGVVLYTLWSLAGPFAAPWAVIISLFGRKWPFWSKVVWQRPQSERTGA
jgi:hypothetical protein